MVKLNFSANPPLAIKGEIFCLFVLFITNTSFVRGQWKDTIALRETVVSLSVIDRFLAKSASKIPKRVASIKYKSQYAIQAINVEQDTFQFKSIVNTYYLKKHIDWSKSIHQQYHWEYDTISGDINPFKHNGMIKMDLSYFKQLVQVQYIHDLLSIYLRKSIIKEMDTTSDNTVFHFKGKLSKEDIRAVEINRGILVFGNENQMLKQAKLFLDYKSLIRESEYKIKTILQWSFLSFDRSNEVSDLSIQTTVYSKESNAVIWKIKQCFSKINIPVHPMKRKPKTFNTEDFFEFNCLHK